MPWWAWLLLGVTLGALLVLAVVYRELVKMWHDS